MKFFPMFLRMEDRSVLIAGGGETAAQKARLMLKTEARITLLAPDLDPELAALAGEGRVAHVTGPIAPALFEGHALVFIGTGCPGCDAALHDLARCARALVNVVDQPHLCEATTPSIVDRDPLVVAIGTEGAAPVLARQVKTRLEELLEPRLGELVALAGRLRDQVALRVPRAKRREFWRWVFAGQPRQLHARGAEREAAERVKAAIAAGSAPGDTGAGAVCIAGAGAARDLLTLRAVARLQEADLVFCDAGLPDGLLELARRDAERVLVGHSPGTEGWAEAETAQAARAASAAGARVVWLARRTDQAAAQLDGAEVIPGPAPVD